MRIRATGAPNHIGEAIPIYVTGAGNWQAGSRFGRVVRERCQHEVGTHTGRLPRSARDAPSAVSLIAAAQNSENIGFQFLSL
jgi:hypothetical protein